MLTAILAMSASAALFGLLLGYSAIRFKVEGNPVVDQIDAMLPQTQCGQCGFPGCRPYAEAIAKGEADINQCPPGGEATIQALADLLGVDPKPLDAEHGGTPKPKSVAFIDEQTCIGCTLCIQACPVDAIVGAAKQMHTVIEVGMHRLRTLPAALPGRLHRHGHRKNRYPRLEMALPRHRASPGGCSIEGRLMRMRRTDFRSAAARLPAASLHERVPR